ncbi:glutamyl-tRNA reductase [Desulfuromusa kysingii]|uniref:Glutamyl-tRNA reductase n=1 Tax=Desulfuromusa kysingii TaxID=37625 RepID=A0A1H3XLL4_9BACT|nr:glutamyl-tRNA reductase [Desulfuromusa kysingii]SDZ99514.1 glutamyl-tRNA reductase [Desulfuromusa kysingii]
MNIVIVGLSHKTAPVEIREKVAFSPAEIEHPLKQLLALPSVSEAVIVSTCNRVELYGISRQPDVAIMEMKQFLAQSHGLESDVLAPHLYDFSGAEAIVHVLRVASSLDSMMIGEPQILGQIKTAYGYACEYKTVGLILNRFLRKAFSVAKRVRSETAIASNAVSVSFAAVELARKIFDSLENKTVMLIGAGEMCELAAKHFINNGVSNVLVTNRTFSRAERLAEEFNGTAVSFENFREQLHRVDIVLSSTGAPDYVLGAKKLKAVCKERRYKPMFLIDIAVPRDIDPAANKLDSIYLYDVDDLQGVVQANLKERQKEAAKAELIINEEVGQFQRWLATLEVKPTIVALRQKMEQVRQGEVEKTFSNLNGLNAKERKAIESMSSAIINKILHHPTHVLKQTSTEDDSSLYLDAVRTLFDLPDVDRQK